MAKNKPRLFGGLDFYIGSQKSSRDMISFSTAQTMNATLHARWSFALVAFLEFLEMHEGVVPGHRGRNPSARVSSYKPRTRPPRAAAPRRLLPGTRNEEIWKRVPGELSHHELDLIAQNYFHILGHDSQPLNSLDSGLGFR